MIRVCLDAFFRYNVKFYNATLVTVNKTGAELVIRIGEFTATSKIEELCEAASKCRIVHLPQIESHLAIGEAEAQKRADMEAMFAAYRSDEIEKL